MLFQSYDSVILTLGVNWQVFTVKPRICTWRLQAESVVYPAFHDADTDTDTDILTDILAIMSVSVSMSLLWNAALYAPADV